MPSPPRTVSISKIIPFTCKMCDKTASYIVQYWDREHPKYRDNGPMREPNGFARACDDHVLIVTADMLPRPANMGKE